MEQDEPHDASMELYNHRPYRTFSQNLLGSMGRSECPNDSIFYFFNLLETFY